MKNLEVFVMKGSPASTPVMALLKEMNLSYQKISLSYFDGDHLKEDFVKMNPQRQVPTLKDGDFCISESVAIMQYLCDAYGSNMTESLYPKDPEQRAIINHRLAFHLSTFYPKVSRVHTLAFRVQQGWCTEPKMEQLKKNSLRHLAVFEKILQDQGTTFAAGDLFTIADIVMMTSATILEMVGFDFAPYPCIAKWLDECKNAHPKAWREVKECRDVLREYYTAPIRKQDYEDLEHLREQSFKKILA